MHVLLVPNRTKDAGLAVTREAAALLCALGQQPVMPNGFAADVPASGIEFLPEEQAFSAADCVLTVGGDGTLLRAGARCAALGKPVLGVNLGRTGFLATCEVSELKTKLARLAAGDCIVQQRMLLDAAVPTRGWHAQAINDVIVFGRTRLHTLDYGLYCDGVFVSRYRSDGLIAATPTGSTAYSFSAGGPVLDARSGVMVITPVCAHSLHAVPLVFDADRTLTIVPDQENRGECFAGADSTAECPLAPGEELRLHRADHTLPLITFDASEQFCAIENKLMRR